MVSKASVRDRVGDNINIYIFTLGIWDFMELPRTEMWLYLISLIFICTNVYLHYCQ